MLVTFLFGLLGALPAIILHLFKKTFSFLWAFLIATATCVLSHIAQITFYILVLAVCRIGIGPGQRIMKNESGSIRVKPAFQA